eukprot:768005-Hanusia_phi.AAC.6
MITVRCGKWRTAQRNAGMFRQRERQEMVRARNLLHRARKGTGDWNRGNAAAGFTQLACP